MLTKLFEKGYFSKVKWVKLNTISTNHAIAIPALTIHHNNISMIKSVKHGIPFLIQIGYTIFFMTNKPLNLCAWQTFVTKKCIIGKIDAWKN